MKKTLLTILLLVAVITNFGQVVRTRSNATSVHNLNAVDAAIMKAGVDMSPSAFLFTDITDATLSTEYTSNGVPLLDFSYAYAYTSPIEDSFRVGVNGVWRDIQTTVYDGDTLYVKHTSSASNSTATNTILTVGGISDTYTTTTIAGDIYYVSEGGGGDTLATIAEVNALTLNPGDSVLFNRGDEWREQLTIDQSGSVGSPITFGAYGTGARPIFNGADVETGWKSENGGGTTVLIDDDMSSDNTGDWNLLDCSLAFDTDHYEVTYVTTSQYVTQSSMGISNGDSVEISIDVKDGTISSGNTLMLRGETLVGYGEFTSNNFGTTSSWVTHTYAFTADEDLGVVGLSSNMAGAGNIEIKNFTANIITEGDGTLWSLPITSTIGSTGFNLVIVDDSMGNREYTKSAVDASLDYYISSGDSLYLFSVTNPDSRTAEVSKRGYGVYLLNQSYVTIENLDCRYAEYAGIALRNNTSSPITGNNIVSYCDLYYNFYNGFTVFDNDDASGMNNNLIEHCSASYNGNGYYSVRSDYNLFQTDTLLYTIAYTTPFTDGHGIGAFRSDSTIIEYCYGVDNQGGSVGFDPDHNLGFKGNDGIIRYNKFYRSTGNGSSIGIQDISDSSSLSIYYNLLVATGGGATNRPFGWNNNSTSQSSTDEGYLYVYNNTVYIDNDQSYRSVDSRYADNVFFKNNITYTTSETGVIARWGDTGGGTVTSDYNLYYGVNIPSNDIIQNSTSDTKYTLSEWQTFGQGTNSDEADPTFTTNGSDFTLQVGSPAINNGTDVGLTTDILGNPIIGVPDMGAYENQDTPYTGDTTKFYVSNDGSDSNNGYDLPWLTVAKVNAATLEAGDNVYFERGDEWREQLAPICDGTSGNPVTFSAYGSGNQPKLTAMDLIETWTSYGGTSDSVTDWHRTFTTDANSTSWSNFRQVIESDSLSMDGDSVRVLITASGTATTVITGASIGERSGSTDDFASTPTRLTFGGSSATSVTAGNTEWSDWVEFAVDTTKDYLVHIFVGTNSSYRYNGVGTAYRIADNDDQTLTESVDYGASSASTRIVSDLRIKTVAGASNVWQATYAGTPTAVYMDSSTGDVQASIVALVNEFDWFWVSNVLYAYAATDPDSRYTTVEAAQASDYATINLSADNYLTFDNLDIAIPYPVAGGEGIRAINSTDMVIQNCTIHGKYLDVPTKGMQLYNAVNAQILDNDIHTALYGVWFSHVDGGIGDALVSGNTIYDLRCGTASDWDGIKVAGVDRNYKGLIIEYNEIHDFCEDGIDLYGSQNVVVRYNTIYNTSNYRVSDNASGIKGGRDYGGSDSIYYNLIYDIEDGGSINWGIVGSPDSAYIFNNTIFNVDYGIGLVSSEVIYSEVKNNILSNVSTNNIQINTGVTNSDIDNNIYDSNTGTQFSWLGSSYNFADWKTNSSQDANAIQDYIEFTDSTSGDFSLQVGSPAINAGTDVGLTEDILGNPIVGVPDMGAYELQYDPDAFYVSNDGNDSNTGNAPDSAWLTISKVNAASFNAGDKIYFERGDEFRGQLVKTDDGASGNHITFGAYGTGDKPIINGNNLLASDYTWIDKGDSVYASAFTHSGSTIWNAVEDGIPLSRPVQEGTNGDKSDITAAGQWIASDALDSIFIRTTGDVSPDDGGIVIEFTTFYSAFHSWGDYITIENLEIVGGYYALELINGYTQHDIIVQNCTMRSCYGDAIKMAGDQPADFNNPVHINKNYNIQILSNDIYHFGESGVDNTGGENITIKYNTIHDGIACKAYLTQYSGSENNGIMIKNYAVDNIVEGNKIYNMPYLTFGAIGIGGDTWGGIKIEAQNVSVRYNTIWNVHSTTRTTIPSYIIQFMAARDCSFYNNTIAYSTVGNGTDNSEALIIFDLSVTDSASHYNVNDTIMNNIFWGNTIYGDRLIGEDSSVDVDSLTMDYNLVETSYDYTYKGTTYSTLGTWQAAGFDVNSQSTDPDFLVNAERLANGAFDGGGTGWSTIGEATVNTGVGRVYSSVGDYSLIHQTDIISTDSLYFLFYTVTDNTAGIIQDSYTGIVLPDDVGYNEKIMGTITGGQTGFGFKRVSGATDISVDNVSLKAINTLIDIAPQVGSPAINNGTDVGLTTDILGNPILGNPDIGAYEYQP